MKKHSSFSKPRESVKGAKPVRRDSREVMSELVTQLRKQENYPHTQLLRQVKGVGSVTALAYVLTLETPLRFVKSRDVGLYVGLVPRQEDSGGTQPQLSISKAGDRKLRKLLVGSAHYILGPFGPDTDLRRFGKKLCARGGKNAKKRATVASGTKLAILLYRLWISGEVYEPLGHASFTPMAQTTAA